MKNFIRVVIFFALLVSIFVFSDRSYAMDGSSYSSILEPEASTSINVTPFKTCEIIYQDKEYVGCTVTIDGDESSAVSYPASSCSKTDCLFCECPK